MFYLEMSRDPTHGGGDWDFGKCLWSPSRKPNDAKWAFWETVLQVHQGDTVLHLRGKGQSASFVGFSTAKVMDMRQPSARQNLVSGVMLRVFIEVSSRTTSHLLSR